MKEERDIPNNNKYSTEAWNALINPKNGILVHPVKETGKITKFGWNKLDLVIYANTWGIYLEEVAIDIEDIQCYTFSLIIEVTGSIFFPMGLNALTEFPAVRLVHGITLSVFVYYLNVNIPKFLFYLAI